jgi:hypothetical protein
MNYKCFRTKHLEKYLDLRSKQVTNLGHSRTRSCLYESPSVLRIVKPRKLTRIEYLARVGETRDTNKIWWINLLG